MKSIEIIPTIVPSRPEDIAQESNRFSSFTSFFQIDVADGLFAPNTTWLPKKSATLPDKFSYEVHLMVSDPKAVGDVFAEAGAHTLIGHFEVFQNPEAFRAAKTLWRSRGVQSVGLAVLYQTPLEAIAPFLENVDFILLMTIPRIGVMGIPFEAESVTRVASFHRMYPDTVIAVDGGVSEKNIADLRRAGASRFGVGSAIAKSENPKAAYERLKSLAESALQ